VFSQAPNTLAAALQEILHFVALSFNKLWTIKASFVIRRFLLEKSLLKEQLDFSCRRNDVDKIDLFDNWQ
jgi:hypothetical protein